MDAPWPGVVEDRLQSQISVSIERRQIVHPSVEEVEELAEGMPGIAPYMFPVGRAKPSCFFTGQVWVLERNSCPQSSQGEFVRARTTFGRTSPSLHRYLRDRAPCVLTFAAA